MTPVTRRDVIFGAELIGLCIGTAIALVFVYAWPELSAWLVARATLPVPAAAACALPAETEQLHIVVTHRGDRIVAECMLVGSRGTYHRSRYGMPQPRP